MSSAFKDFFIVGKSSIEICKQFSGYITPPPPVANNYLDGVLYNDLSSYFHCLYGKSFLSEEYVIL